MINISKKKRDAEKEWLKNRCVGYSINEHMYISILSIATSMMALMISKIFLAWILVGIALIETLIGFTEIYYVEHYGYATVYEQYCKKRKIKNGG